MPKIVAYLFALVFFLLFHPPAFAEDKVTLNEVLVKPDAGQKEWVELYNGGMDSVDLNSYWIDDDESLIVDSSVQTGSADPGSDPKQLSGQILPSQFLIFEFSSYFNDDGDSAAFFNNQGTKIDSYAYDDNPGVNVTFGRKPDGTGSWLVNCNPTPNQANDCPAPDPTPSPSPTPSTSSTSQAGSPTPTPKATSTAIIKSPSPTSVKQSPQVLSARDQDSLLLASLSAETSSPSPSPEATPSAMSKTKVAGILAGSGIVLISLSFGFYLWYKKILRSSPAERDAGLKKALEQDLKEKENGD